MVEVKVLVLLVTIIELVVVKVVLEVLEVIEVLDPEVVRRWPLLSCEFRFQYRKLSYGDK